MPDQNFPFVESNAIIFGGGGNIGRAIALEFARRGANVAVADLFFEGAQETVELVKALGRKSHAIKCDVGDDSSVRSAADEAEKALGPMDIVMNNAGILSGGHPEDIPIAAWRQMMNINFFGMVRSNDVFLPRLIARGKGHIVNTASFAGMYPFASSRIHYAASKAAVLSMSENLALYLMPKGIRVSCLCPGPVAVKYQNPIKSYTDNYTMRMPGSHLVLKRQEDAARTLADGMRDGRIIIPTDEKVWETLKQRSASPDDYIRNKNAEFESGNSGKPQIPEDIMKEMSGR